MIPKSFFLLNKEQVAVIKGVAIILIVFHNYIHGVSGVGENEMNYDSAVLNNLFKTIISNPFSVLNGLFSYFGHLGV